MIKISLRELERHLIQPKEWMAKYKSYPLPPEIMEMVDEEVKCNSGSFGIAKHPEVGYSVLASGQGPICLWAENEDKVERR